jgi:serine/threonine-protein kinase
MNDEGRIEDLLIRWEAAKLSGRPVSPEVLCADWPEGVRRLRRAIRLLEMADRVLDLEGSEEGLPGARGRPTPDSSLAVPEYEVLEELDRGGMGIVYRALHTVLQREVALKVLRPGTAAEPRRVRRFVREAQALARLRHENIVPIYEARFHQGQFYFAMEFVRGGSLAAHMDRYSQNPAAAAEIVEKVARAVQHAHEENILHRDLKPANILLDESGRPLVADFGLARFTEPTDGARPANGKEGPEGPTTDVATVVEPLTDTGVLPGTPPYMAPEQFRPDLGPVTKQTDVWALGVILYELLTGRRPFKGKDVGAIGRAVCEEAPARPGAVRPGLDRGLEAIVTKCLRKDPAQRYASAARVAAELKNWRDGEPLEVLPAGRSRRAVRWAVRHPAVTTALLLLCGFGGVIPFAIPPRPQPAEDPEERAEREYRQAAERADRDLAEGRPVALLDTAEGAFPYRRRFGDVQVRVADERVAQGQVRVVARSLSLLEVFPNPSREAYRVRIRMRHDDWLTPMSNVGVYVAHHSQTTPVGPQHFFVRFVFADVGDKALLFKDRNGQKGSHAEFGLSYVGASPTTVYQTTLSGFPYLFYLPQAPYKYPGPWRDLTVEVTSPRVRAVWGTLEVGEIGSKELTKWFQGLMRRRGELKGISPAANFRGAFGLFLYNASLSIQSLSVEPLDRSKVNFRR